MNSLEELFCSMVNLLGGLIAYCLQPKKPSLNINATFVHSP